MIERQVTKRLIVHAAGSAVKKVICKFEIVQIKKNRSNKPPRNKNKITMNYLTYTEKLNYLLEMIENGQLLSLKQTGEKFYCSERTIKRMLKTLRKQGYNIEYCKSTKKFFIKK
jgi:biotin operon repressor